MQAISTRPFSRALYRKRYTRRMRSGDETIPVSPLHTALMHNGMLSFKLASTILSLVTKNPDKKFKG